MFLGLLIGLTLFGLLLAAANSDDRKYTVRQRTTMQRHRYLGLLCLILGFCGSVGWIVEVIF